MMFGHIEGRADRVHHMALTRQWQDRSLAEFGEGVRHPGHRRARIAGGRGTTQLHLLALPAREHAAGPLKEWGRLEGEEHEPFPGDVVATLDGDGDPKAHPEFGRRLRTAGSVEYLRTQAVSRLMLDNIYSIGSSWVTMGPHVGQTALFFGASDMGSVMMEENVVSSAGTTYCLDEAVLCRLIRDAGFTPAQRDSEYNIIRAHTGTDSPDKQVEDWSTHRADRLHAQNAPDATADLTVSVSRP